MNAPTLQTPERRIAVPVTPCPHLGGRLIESRTGWVRTRCDACIRELVTQAFGPDTLRDSGPRSAVPSVASSRVPQVAGS